MKKSILSIFGAISLAASAAELVTLVPGATNAVPAGRVIAIEALTVTAAQQVKLGCVDTVVNWTNCQSVAWTYATNYVVCTSNLYTAATNVTTVSRPWDTIRWPNQTVLWCTTNDVSTSVTNVWREPGTSYEVSTNLFTGTASGHYLKALPSSLYILGGRITVTAGDSDSVRVLIGD